VKSVDAAGFNVHHDMITTMTPQQAYRAFTRLSRWWSADHTYSGDARNLSLTMRPGGCWCETLPQGGFVEHMRVVYAAPGEAVRLIGGLGPLQAMGVQGALTVTFKPREGGGAHIVANYAATGRSASGWAGIASAVDGVLGGQFARLAALRAP
jgi:uncharacterized protein YndB with AHSA1/START domain